ncbi:uncharacterized protein isoform X11 [Choristoneura fumiferana]|uniref:uncharacterized protein isoform X11 n=1 Tax=Choristoneura fumiferana TaxID=7141 RepID=UPI003D15CCB1
MKAVGILLLVLVAMAASQVNVVDNNNPGGVNVVDNSDPNKVHVVEQPDPVHVVDNSGQGIDSSFYRPSAGGNSGIVDDAAFGRPSVNNPEQPSIAPAFVDPPSYQPGAQPQAPLDIVDPAFYRPSDPPQGPILDIVDAAFYRPSDLVDLDPAFYQPSDPNAPNYPPVISNPDEGFYLPSGPEDSSFYRPSGQSQNYPPKQYPNPLARGGK